MIIDIHSHVYKHPLPFVTRFLTPEELIKTYDNLGIDKAVLLPVVSPEIYFPQSVDEILEVCDQYPDRFIPYCNVDPRSMTNSERAPLLKALEYYKSKGCKGIGEVMPNMHILNPMVQNLFAAAEAAEMPLVFDGSDVLSGDFGLYDDPGLPGLEHTLQRFKKLKIFGHGPVFWSEIARLKTPGERNIIFNFSGDSQVGIFPSGKIQEEGSVPILLRRYENLMCDLSDYTPVNALSRDLEYTAKFLDEFQDRLYFGTDLCNLGMDVPQVRFFKDLLEKKVISDAVYDKITYINACKLLDIKI